MTVSMDVNVDQLKKLYFDDSKHAVYQNIPGFIQKALGFTVTIDEKWRGDTARWDNLKENLDVNYIQSLGDIGANTGFFSLSIAHRFPQLTVHAYEANQNHHHFIDIIKNQFHLANIHAHNQFINLNGIGKLSTHDCLLNLNVLHHAGVDFDKDAVCFESFFDYACRYLDKLSHKSKKMIFQMGFNWGGNKNYPIVLVNDDPGKILFLAKIFQKSGWRIEKIFTMKKPDVFKYFEMPSEISSSLDTNLKKAEKLLYNYYIKYRLVTFSEFYRRPIFYCSSRVF
jgi:hypothetical protein